MSTPIDEVDDIPSPRRGEGGAQRRVRAVRPSTSIPRARALRVTMTNAERRFWNVVRNRSFDGLKFVRQYPVGPYIADFACRERMLIVELDGSQHAEDEAAYDLRRTLLLNSEGYSVLRFWNNEVLKELNGVQELLHAVTDGHRPSPGWRYSPATLSPVGRGDPTGSITT